MKVSLFSVYDSKVRYYSRPFIHRNAAEAIRGFELACNEKESQLNCHSADFNLFEIGEFDDQSGHIIPHEKHINLGCASSFIKPDVVKGGQIEMFNKGNGGK